MSRLPRHLSRVKPPLRGRAATQHYRGEFAPIAVVRRPPSPYGSGPLAPGRGTLTSMPDQEPTCPVRKSSFADVAPTNRSPRHPSRVQPPLRGRAATRHFRGEFAPAAAVRHTLNPPSSRPLAPEGESLKPVPPPPPQKPKPPEPPPLPEPPISSPPAHTPPTNNKYAVLVQLYRRWKRFIRSLDQPWQWIVVVVIVLLGLFLLNRLL